MPKEKLLTAAEWCRELDFSIIDADGWRYENGDREFFEKPIALEEFRSKLGSCASKKGFEQKHEDHLRAIYKENLQRAS